MVILYLVTYIFAFLYTVNFSNKNVRFICFIWVLSTFLYSYNGIIQLLFNGKYSASAEFFLLYTAISLLFTIIGMRIGSLINIPYFIINEKKIIYYPSKLAYLVLLFLMICLFVLTLEYMPPISSIFTLNRYEYIKLEINPSLPAAFLANVVSGYMTAFSVNKGLFDYFKPFKELKNSLKLLIIKFQISFPNLIIFLTLIPFLLVLILYLARGDRNPILLFLAPLIASLIKIEKIKIKRLLQLSIIAFSMVQIVEIVRSLGVTLFLKLLFDDYTYEIGNQIQNILVGGGEFISSIRSFHIYLANNYEFNNYINDFPGHSIIFGPILNFFKTLKIVDNYTTIAGEFAVLYGKSWGLGFSHQLESFINFGLLGPLFYYIPLGILLTWIGRISALNKSVFWRSIYYLLIPILINMQRIDLAVLSKLYLYSVFGVIFYSAINIPFNKYYLKND